MKVKKRGRGAPRGYNGGAFGSRAAVALGASGSQAAGRAGLPAKGMIMHSPRWQRATRAAALAASFAGTFSSDSFKAVINSRTDQGQTIRSSMTGRRIGDCAK